jgi:hypothetical protein
MAKIKSLILKCFKMFPFALVRRQELARLRSSESTWKLAIASLERHNETQKKA